jgi:hypothetical protein
VEGIMGAEATELLRRFFAARRIGPDDLERDAPR